MLLFDGIVKAEVIISHKAEKMIARCHEGVEFTMVEVASRNSFVAIFLQIILRVIV
jgi:hypothetical protein